MYKSLWFCWSISIIFSHIHQIYLNPSVHGWLFLMDGGTQGTQSLTYVFTVEFLLSYMTDKSETFYLIKIELLVPGLFPLKVEGLFLNLKWELQADMVSWVQW